MNKNPDKCISSPTYQSWRDKPNGFTRVMLSYTPNSDLIKEADSICPGRSLSVDGIVSADDIEISGDRVSIPIGKVALHCEFFEADHGKSMGS